MVLVLKTWKIHDHLRILSLSSRLNKNYLRKIIFFTWNTYFESLWLTAANEVLYFDCKCNLFIETISDNNEKKCQAKKKLSSYSRCEQMKKNKMRMKTQKLRKQEMYIQLHLKNLLSKIYISFFISLNYCQSK